MKVIVINLIKRQGVIVLMAMLICQLGASYAYCSELLRDDYVSFAFKSLIPPIVSIGYMTYKVESVIAWNEMHDLEEKLPDYEREIADLFEKNEALTAQKLTWARALDNEDREATQLLLLDKIAQYEKSIQKNAWDIGFYENLIARHATLKNSVKKRDIAKFCVAVAATTVTSLFCCVAFAVIPPQR